MITSCTVLCGITNSTMDGIQEYGGPDERNPCPICGRMFNPRPLQIHIKSCEKNARKPRKVFDSTKQRAQGTEISLKQMKAAQKKVVAPPKTNWRAQHADFINTVRAARGVTVAMKTGQPLPPPPPPSINPDYVQCPYCERRFNQKAAERHIGFCKDQHARKGNKPNAIAKKPPSRIQAPKSSVRSSPNTATTPAASRLPASRAAPASSSRPAVGSVSRTPASKTGVSSTRGRTQPPSYTASDYSDHGTEEEFYSTPSFSGKALRTGHSPQLDDENNSAKLKKLGFNRSSPLLQQRKKQQELQDGVKGTLTRRPSGSTSMCTKKDADYGYYSNSSECDSPSMKISSSNYKPNLAANTISRVPSGKRNSGQHIATLSRKPANIGTAANGSTLASFCHDCGTKYPIVTAKFCCECGMRRLTLS